LHQRPPIDRFGSNCSEFEVFMRCQTGRPEQPRRSFIDFQRPSLSDAPPEGDGWIHATGLSADNADAVLRERGEKERERLLAGGD
jgi:hypothetical protein